MAVRSFKDLVVWQKGIELVKEVYKSTNKLPKAEDYGLTSQMCRCAISTPSNIAEGKQRGTRKDFSQFLRVAHGSAAELETQIILAKELYPGIDFTHAEEQLTEVQKMLAVMIKRLQLPKS